MLRMPRWVQRHGWLVLCSTVLILATLGVLGYIFKEILSQSFHTGQFWNSIIALGYIGVTLFVGLLTFFLRLARDRVWLQQLPRDHTLSSRDAPQRVIEVIEGKFSECLSKFEAQISVADHPGLQNPRLETPLESPYFTIIEGMPVLIEESILSFYARFKRKPSMSIRNYLAWALESNILEECMSANIDQFVEQYEKARFGGEDLKESAFYELFTGCITVVRSIKVPEQPKIEFDAASDSGSVIVRKSSYLADEDPLQQYILSRRPTREHASDALTSETALSEAAFSEAAVSEAAMSEAISPELTSQASLSSLSRWNTRASHNSTHTVLHHH